MSDSAQTGTVTRRPSGGSAASVVRVVVSGVLLLLIISRLDLSAVLAAMSALDWRWVAGAVWAVYAAIVLSAFKWGVLLRARGYRLGMARLTRHYLVGLFFNNFLPTSVGGDAVRAWDVGRDIDDAPDGAASVIAERLIASVGLAFTAAIGLPFARVGVETYVAVAAVAVFGVGLAGLFLVPSLSERVVGSAMGGRFETVAGWVGRATAAVRDLLRRPTVVFVVLGLSIGFQVLVAAVNWCLLQGLASPVSLGTCIVYTSIISAVTMVPISISGHGVREAGYAYFFGLASVAETTAVTASLLFFATVAICTLPGAVLFAAGRRRHP